MFDQLLEMNSDQVQAECQKYGLTVVDKQIRNIQSIIKYLNEQEKLLSKMETVSQEDDVASQKVA